MQKNITDRPYSNKVTEAALFMIDAIKRKRMKGITHDSTISKLLGCAPQTIHYWRNGERSITLDQLGKLIYEFNVNPVFLMKQEGSPWGEAELMLSVASLEQRMDIVEEKLGIEKQVKKKVDVRGLSVKIAGRRVKPTK